MAFWTRHLKQGTQKDNMQDAVIKGRAAKGEVHGRSKLTVEQVLLTRDEYEVMDVKNTAKLARKYKVCQQTAHRVVTRKIWKHV